MKRFAMLATAFVFFIHGAVGTGGDDISPGRLALIDLRNSGQGFKANPVILGSEKGDVLQFFSIGLRIDKTDIVRTFKFTIKGDAVTVVGIVELPSVIDRKKGVPAKLGVDQVKKNMGILFKSAKEGKATVTITPIYEDGNMGQAIEFLVQVSKRTKEPEEKK